MAATEKRATAESDAQKEKQKKVLAGVLFVLLGAVFYFQDPLGWFTSEAPEPTVANAKPLTSPSPRTSPTPRVGGTKEETRIADGPLNLQPIFAKFTPLDGISRNIFVYPTPTPPPPPPPVKQGPPPTPVPTPPIVVVGILPTGVIGRTGDFELTVTGLKFPGDARVYIEGREAQTSLLDESHLKVKVSAEAIRNPGNLGVQVRSVGDPAMFSNQMTLNVAEPPRPPFRYVGLIVSRQGKIGVLKPDSDDDPFNVREGESYGTNKKWRVVSINPQKMELMDNDIKVSHTIPFSPDGTNP